MSASTWLHLYNRSSIGVLLWSCDIFYDVIHAKNVQGVLRITRLVRYSILVLLPACKEK
jgi:hypothetical protein